MFAVISDIHGNLDALDAVLMDVARRGCACVYCLGDVVGYGPNPVECLDRAMEWDVSILGNHDQAALFGPDGFSQSAERAIFWTRRTLEASRRSDLLLFLNDRPRQFLKGEFLFVHGSARNTLNEYVFPEDVYNTRKMASISTHFERFCFCGHTHVPGVFVEPEPGADWTFFSPEERNGAWRFDARKTIVNVGSVGQPRDGNWRPCYVTVDGGDVAFHRVEYDWQKTRDKIYKIPELDNFLGDRLGEGR